MNEQNLIRKVFTIIPEIKQGLKKGIVIAFFYEAVKFLPLILIKYIIDFLVAGQSSVMRLSYFLGGVLIALVVLESIDYIARRFEFQWMIKYETSILKKAKKKLLELHLGYHESFNTGAQVSKINKGAHRLTELLWFTFEEFIPTSIQLILTFILLLYEQWIIAFLFAVFTPVILGITLTASKRAQPFRRKYHQKYDEAIGELGESILNITTVKDYVQERKQFAKFQALLQEYEYNAIQRWRYAETLLLWRDVVITLGRVITLGLASYFVIKGTLSAGSLVLVYTLTERAFIATHRIGRLYSYLEDAMESINRMADLLQQEALIKDFPNAKTVHALEGNIHFKNVSFSYGQGNPVLHDITLNIKPKQIVALVGRSGSGKTTIARLLLRHYDVSKGEIFVDGQNIKQYKLQDYKKRIAVVSQNVEIFNRTVLENILFAHPNATREEAIAAAKKAHAHDFITSFQNGYDTMVGEKGVRLSGGQKQRISIARALLKDPDIYNFDEATSSLDSESEQYIQRSIFSIAGKKTTIIIAHRLSTIKKADRILVMDAGKIVEEGTYEQLLAQKGHFAKMVHLQDIAELRE